MRIGTVVAGAIALAMSSNPASAKDYVVKMLNEGAAGTMVFEPALVKVDPGDTVTFVATDPGHNVESIASMLPTGAEPFKGKMNQDLTVKFTQPGTYGFKCLPHYLMGMVGAVIVGDGQPNAAQARRAEHSPKPKQVFARILR